MTRAKQALVIVAMVIGWMAFLHFGVAFAVSDWLRFASPAEPNVSTGQVIYMKAAKGVFYVTPEQHFWLETLLLPDGLAVFASMALLKWLRPEKMTWNRWVKALGFLIAVASMLLWLLLSSFSDQIIAMLTTGSPTLPPEPGGRSAPGVLDWLESLIGTVLIVMVILSLCRSGWKWWRDVRGRREQARTPTG